MKSITVQNAERSEIYSVLIGRVMRYAFTSTLVVRPAVALSAKGKAFMAAAEPDLVVVSEVTEWPGTKLIHGTATLYCYSLSANLQNLLLLSAESLASWLQPDLPEDLAFYRKDGTLIMGSISHEGDIFLELLPEEEGDFEALFLL